MLSAAAVVQIWKNLRAKAIGTRRTGGVPAPNSTIPRAWGRAPLVAWVWRSRVRIRHSRDDHRNESHSYDDHKYDYNVKSLPVPSSIQRRSVGTPVRRTGAGSQPVCGEFV